MRSKPLRSWLRNSTTPTSINRHQKRAALLELSLAPLLCYVPLYSILFSGRSSLHLPPVVALYTSDRLLQTIRTTMLMIWMLCLMLVKYDACPGVGYSGLWMNQICPVFLLIIATSKASVRMIEKYFESRLERMLASNIGLTPTLSVATLRLRHHHHQLLFHHGLSRCNDQLTILTLNWDQGILSEAKFSQPGSFQLDLRNILVVVSALCTNLQLS